LYIKTESLVDTVGEQVQDSLISLVESQSIFEEEKSNHLDLKKIDLVTVNYHASRNQTNNSVGNERSSEVVNYETRNVQSANHTNHNNGPDGEESEDMFAKEEYYLEGRQQIQNLTTALNN